MIFRKIIILQTLLLTSVTLCDAQSWLWVKSAGGTGNDYGKDIAADLQGNVYIWGEYDDICYFDKITLTRDDVPSIMFIAKYNTVGEVQWVKDLSGYSARWGGITLDTEGNIYITGQFAKTVKFDTISLTSQLNEDDIFIAKYNNLLNVQWAKKAGGKKGDNGFEINVDKNGNVYVTGNFYSDTAYFDDQFIVSNGEHDIFITKYNSIGEIQWVKSAGGPENFDYSYSITSDVFENVYITGIFKDTAYFDDQFIISKGGMNLFFAKYDPDGNVEWVKNASSSIGAGGSSLDSDNFGNIYLTGWFSDTTNFGDTSIVSSGGTDIFIAKYNSKGELKWIKRFGGSQFDDRGNAITTDKEGNVYTTGEFFETGEFDDTTLQSKGKNDVFVTKHDSTGKLLWIIQGGDITNENALSISTDTAGNCYITGMFYESTRIGDCNLICKGPWDMFVAKIGPIFPSFDIEPISSKNCENDSIRFCVKAIGTPPLSYQWQKDGLDIVNAHDSTYLIYPLSLSDNGIYRCIISNIYGKDTSTSASLVINPLPSVFIGNDTAFCFGDSIILEAGLSEFYTYNWNYSSTEHQVTIKNTGSYSVLVTDTTGCTSTDSINIVVNDRPVLDLGTDTSFCQGNYIILDAGYGDNYIYEWNTGSPEQTILVDSTGIYTIKITNPNGCFSSDEVSVKVHPIPPLDLGNDTAICFGSKLALHAGKGYIYDWSTGETNQSIDVSLSGTYSVSITDTNSCENSDTISVIVSKPYENEEICIVTVSSANNNIIVWEKTPASGIATYNIYKETSAFQYNLIGNTPYNALSIYTDTLSNPAVKSDRYKITVIDSCGNESNFSEHHGTMHLTSNLGVGGVVNLIWENYEGFYIDKYFIYRGTAKDNLTQVGWIQGNLSTFTDESPPPGELYYQVGSVKQTPCYPTINKKSDIYGETKSNIISVQATYINDVTESKRLNIYPNPLNNKTLIQFDNENKENYQLFIIDMAGTVVDARDNIFSDQFEYDGSNLSNGIYILELRGSKLLRGKIVVDNNY